MILHRLHDIVAIFIDEHSDVPDLLRVKSVLQQLLGGEVYGSELGVFLEQFPLVLLFIIRLFHLMISVLLDFFVEMFLYLTHSSLVLLQLLLILSEGCLQNLLLRIYWHLAIDLELSHVRDDGL
jgi:hypothetical protein